MLAFPFNFCQQRVPGSPPVAVCDCEEIGQLTVLTAAPMFSADPKVPVELTLLPYPEMTLFPAGVLAIIDPLVAADFCLFRAEGVALQPGFGFATVDVYLAIPKISGAADSATYPARIILIGDGGAYVEVAATRTGALGCHDPSGGWDGPEGWVVRIGGGGIPAFDGSAMTLPAADLWLAAALGGTQYFHGFRRFAMNVEWYGLPVGTTVEINPGWTAPVGPVAAGTAGAAAISSRIQATVNFNIDYNSAAENAWFSEMYDGNDYPAGQNFSQTNNVTDTAGTSANVIFGQPENFTVIIRNSANTILNQFVVNPRLTTTLRMRSFGITPTDEVSGRAVRILHSGGVFSLLTPSGFLVT